jgi:hypothetical protein
LHFYDGGPTCFREGHIIVIFIFLNGWCFVGAFLGGGATSLRGADRLTG